jgi:hypothetical protein
VAAPHSVLEAALDSARTHRRQDLDDLVEELRIPSISTLPERRDDCLLNARWLRDRFRAMGMEANVVDVLPNRLPVVVADSPRLPGRPHVTIYGHSSRRTPWRSGSRRPSNRRFATATCGRAARPTTRETIWRR